MNRVSILEKIAIHLKHSPDILESSPTLKALIEELNQSSQSKTEIELLLDISNRLKVVEGKIDQGRLESDRLNKYDAARLLNCNPSYLIELRRTEWKEGIHFWKVGREYQYNRILIDDWAKNKCDPILHQRAIEVWARSQLGNQKKRA